MRSMFVMLAFIFLQLFSRHAAALTIELKEMHWISGRENIAAIYLDGQIEKGDFLNFQKIIRQNWKVLSSKYLIAMNSPGGDLAEARKIAQEIARVGAVTVVPLRAQCASACVLLWAAGFQRLTAVASSNETKLGVHRGFISPELYSSLSNDEARRTSREIRKIVSDAFAEFDLPAQIIDLANNTPGSQIAWIKADDALGLMFPSWIEDRMAAQCPEVADADRRQRSTFDRFEDLAKAVEAMYEKKTKCVAQLLRASRSDYERRFVSAR